MSKRAKLSMRVGSHVDESIGASTREVKIAQPAGASPPRERVRADDKTFRIPLGFIDPDEEQPRKTFDDDSLAELAASLKESGQLQPCVVRPATEKGRYVLVMGERRFRAARLAGLAELLCRVEVGRKVEEILADQLVENLQRQDMNPVELADALKRLVDRHGWSTRRIAERLGITQSKVARALALAELPEEVQARVADGRLGQSTAVAIGRLEDPEEQVRVAKLAVTWQLNRDQVEALVERRLSHGDSPEPSAEIGSQAPPAAEVSHRDSLAEAAPPATEVVKVPGRPAETRGIVWGCDLPSGATVSVILPPGAELADVVIAIWAARDHFHAEDDGRTGRWPIDTEIVVETSPADPWHGWRGKVVGYDGIGLVCRLEAAGKKPVEKSLVERSVKRAACPKGESRRAARC
jgi:ParB family chromosome partitioning protein